jgi:hypothetical protein
MPMPSPGLLSLHCNLGGSIFPIIWPSQSNAYLVCPYVLNYSTCKCANWVVQAFLKPSLVPKCNRCYSRVIGVTFTQ